METKRSGRDGWRSPGPEAARFPLLTTAEVARRLSVTTREVCDMVACGEIRAMRLGRRWRFHPADLQRYIDEKLPPPGGRMK
jgi:excisionase family DNA binding protein